MRHENFTIMNIDDLYHRPGMIINRKIAQLNKDGTGVWLRKDLRELNDYVFVSISSYNFRLKTKASGSI